MMKLQTMPNKHLCMVTAFAMALDMDVSSLLPLLPDPYQRVFDTLPEPHCFRGHHIQDLIPLARSYGYSCTPYEFYPAIANIKTSEVFTLDHESIVSDAIWLKRGILTGIKVTSSGRVGHAVAFDHGYIYDPNGQSYLFSCLDACRPYFPNTAWVIERAL